LLLTAAVAAGVINTNLARHKLFARIFYALAAVISKSEPQGAATNVYCAFGEVEGGAYYAGTNFDCCLFKIVKFLRNKGCSPSSVVTDCANTTQS
jgi:hypothetical protein